jgi:7-carboxy-7-deazaguanine synthase
MEELLLEFKKWPSVKHLVITGGEPFIFTELPEWVSHFKSLGYVITIETAGTIWRSTTADLISISPKLNNSTPDSHEYPKISQRHEKARINIPALSNFIQQHDCQLKFVLEENEGLTEVTDLLESLPNIAKENIYLMPQTQDKDYSKAIQSLIDVAMQSGFRVTPRLQIAIWGNKRAT